MILKMMTTNSSANNNNDDKSTSFHVKEYGSGIENDHDCRLDLSAARLHLLHVRGPYAPQGSTSLLPKLSVTSKVSAPTSCSWVGSRVHFRSTEDVILLEITSPVDREYIRRRRKFH